MGARAPALLAVCSCDACASLCPTGVPRDIEDAPAMTGTFLAEQLARYGDLRRLCVPAFSVILDWRDSGHPVLIMGLRPSGNNHTRCVFLGAVYGCTLGQIDPTELSGMGKGMWVARPTRPAECATTLAPGCVLRPSGREGIDPGTSAWCDSWASDTGMSIMAAWADDNATTVGLLAVERMEEYLSTMKVDASMACMLREGARRVIVPARQ